jgi:hypothetical protein
MAGYVYLIKMEYLYFSGNDHTIVKVEFNKNKLKNLTKLQSGNPFPLHLLVEIFVTDWKIKEHEINTKFAKKHIRHGWFNLSHKELVDMISILNE